MAFGNGTPKQLTDMRLKNNIPWVAVPHGMLEPWSLSQKRLKKWMYLHLVESPMLRRAHAIKGCFSTRSSEPKQTLWRQGAASIQSRGTASEYVGKG